MTRRDLGPRPLTYPMPVLLVGVYDAEGRPNLMAAAWGGICNSTPPCVSVSIRPSRWTHDPLLQRKAFTLGIPSTALAAQADFTGITCGRSVDKFAATGLTPCRSEHVDAPYAAECPIVLECRLLQHVELPSHTLIIGEICNVSALESCMDGDQPDIFKVDPLVYDAASRHYYRLGGDVCPAYTAGMIYKQQEQKG